MSTGSFGRLDVLPPRGHTYSGLTPDHLSRAMAMLVHTDLKIIQSKPTSQPCFLGFPIRASRCASVCSDCYLLMRWPTEDLALQCLPSPTSHTDKISGHRLYSDARPHPPKAGSYGECIPTLLRIESRLVSIASETTIRNRYEILTGLFHAN